MNILSKGESNVIVAKGHTTTAAIIQRSQSDLTDASSMKKERHIWFWNLDLRCLLWNYPVILTLTFLQKSDLHIKIKHVSQTLEWIKISKRLYSTYLTLILFISDKKSQRKSVSYENSSYDSLEDTVRWAIFSYAIFS